MLNNVEYLSNRTLDGGQGCKSRDQFQRDIPK